MKRIALLLVFALILPTHAGSSGSQRIHVLIEQAQKAAVAADVDKDSQFNLKMWAFDLRQAQSGTSSKYKAMCRKLKPKASATLRRLSENELFMKQLRAGMLSAFGVDESRPPANMTIESIRRQAEVAARKSMKGHFTPDKLKQIESAAVRKFPRVEEGTIVSEVVNGRPYRGRVSYKEGKVWIGVDAFVPTDLPPNYSEHGLRKSREAYVKRNYREAQLIYQKRLLKKTLPAQFRKAGYIKVGGKWLSHKDAASRIDDYIAALIKE